MANDRHRFALSLAATVVVVVAGFIIYEIGFAQGSAEETPDPEDMLAVLSQGRSNDPALEDSGIPFNPEDLDQAAYLEGADGWDYYVASRNDGKICLIAHHPETGAAGCRQAEYFGRSGTGLGVGLPGEPDVITYLIPDGYTEAARQIE